MTRILLCGLLLGLAEPAAAQETWAPIDCSTLAPDTLEAVIGGCRDATPGEADLPAGALIRGDVDPDRLIGILEDVDAAEAAETEVEVEAERVEALEPITPVVVPVAEETELADAAEAEREARREARRAERREERREERRAERRDERREDREREQEGAGIDIPPGHLPPPGSCRVWYLNRPPGHQPPPTSCSVDVPPGARLIRG